MSEPGQIIKKLREQNNWSLREVEKRIGIDYSVISRIESGKRPLKDQEIKAFADLFGVTTAYILGEEDKEIDVAGEKITLDKDEYEVFKELLKHPSLFHDLKKDPEKNVRHLIKSYELYKKYVEEALKDDNDYLE
ncbi:MULTISPECIES: helix-turn-helix domain-containing protein [Heyndrickxia]|uniref:Helix-turn-helix n=1 Tax=Heyndrickxia coagulans DSM 1 = ATCC 7050 TaxID=1121088 RepID=A0A0B5WPP3_HEYCO|nr:helix-turn-helix transcriptional regulator [Heyndrickxia coagulans]AJH76993.1 helix-turn-helix family protein [Heyndrickxia coagulans DSM 1 = ATCC 7050]AJH77890.1 helix-turn-helix family protein [Heyndrickxia coagulans DSM 1 = ATCC 7050]AWP37809.1 XRE family transcriptional regulator [Heyndrickxia coagulans]MCR2847353.1 helix-turn-helix transcriptional regulator [Heyndrickxia coagulans]MDR4225177.1 helix-turn-helix transcriptional regulator [Heyndrickxia coagulans DSM 1 = ATCC 7050]